MRTALRRALTIAALLGTFACTAAAAAVAPAPRPTTTATPKIAVLPGPPFLRPTVVLRSSSLVLSKGTLTAKIACHVARCVGSVELTKQILVKVKRGKRTITERKTIVLASARYALAAGARESLRLRLTGQGKSALAGVSRHHPLRLSLSASVARGKSTSRSVHVT